MLFVIFCIQKRTTFIKITLDKQAWSNLYQNKKWTILGRSTLKSEIFFSKLNTNFFHSAGR